MKRSQEKDALWEERDVRRIQFQTDREDPRYALRFKFNPDKKSLSIRVALDPVSL